jgi:hypothetical protein
MLFGKHKRQTGMEKPIKYSLFMLQHEEHQREHGKLIRQ